MADHPVLQRFSPAVRAWFATSFPEPTSPQVNGWPHIAQGEHTLICAPTGSGKTLTAFLALDRSAHHHTTARPEAAHEGAVHLAAARAGVRRREEPAVAAHGHRPGGRAARRAVRRAVRGHAHRRHRRPKIVRSSSASRPTCSSPRPRASTSCSPRRRATRSSTSTRSSSTRSTPSRPPSAARTSCCRSNGSSRSPTTAAAHRAVGHAAPARRGRPLPGRACRRRHAAAGHHRRLGHPQAAAHRRRHPGGRHGRPRPAGHRAAQRPGHRGAQPAAQQHLAQHLPAHPRPDARAPHHHHLHQRPPPGRAPGRAS